MESRIYQWISLILLMIIIYLLRCYWLPVLKRFTAKSKTNAVPNIQFLNYDEKRNKDLKWNESTGIMPFLGSLDYQRSRKFYSEIGFKVEEGEKYCKVKVNEHLSFWLQNYSNKQWLDNSMLFLDVADLIHLKNKLKELEIEERYKNVKISETKNYEWGNEFFMHDPSGILWHFCKFDS